MLNVTNMSLMVWFSAEFLLSGARYKSVPIKTKQASKALCLLLISLINAGATL